MTNHISGYLLDPAAATLSVVKLPQKDNLQTLYDLIGCTTIDAVRFDDGAIIAFVDDEANFSPILGLWCLAHARQQLYAGRALFVAPADDGKITGLAQPPQALAAKLTSFRPVIEAELTSMTHGAPHEGQVKMEALAGTTNLVHSTTVGLYRVRLEERPVTAQGRFP